MAVTYKRRWRQIVRLNQLGHGRPEADPVRARIVEVTSLSLQRQRKRHADGRCQREYDTDPSLSHCAVSLSVRSMHTSIGLVA